MDINNALYSVKYAQKKVWDTGTVFLVENANPMTFSSSSEKYNYVVYPKFRDRSLAQYSLKMKTQTQKSMAQQSIPIFSPTGILIRTPFSIVEIRKPYRTLGELLRKKELSTSDIDFFHISKSVFLTHVSLAKSAPYMTKNLNDVIKDWIAQIARSLSNSPDLRELYNELISQYKTFTSMKPNKGTTLLGNLNLESFAFENEKIKLIDLGDGYQGPLEWDLASFLLFHKAYQIVSKDQLILMLTPFTKNQVDPKLLRVCYKIRCLIETFMLYKKRLKSKSFSDEFNKRKQSILDNHKDEQFNYIPLNI